MKGKDSNCFGVVSDQVEAVNASNLSEYAIKDLQNVSETH